VVTVTCWSGLPNDPIIIIIDGLFTMLAELFS
jgi:hypothetical protein